MEERRLFTMLLPTNGSAEEATLYYRQEKGTIRSDGRSLLFSRGSVLSFDCYYNAFDYALYRDLTAATRVEYVLSLRGDATVELHLSRLAENAEGYEDVILATRESRSDVVGELVIPLDLASLPGKGILYLSISARSDGAFLGGFIRATTAPLRAVRIGIAITTYRREAYVKHNVKQLLRDLPADRFALFVTDNGGTLTPEDVLGARLIPNRNLGGSGGFTRGILEILASEGFTHILLTDDDISFESEVFLRTAAILSYALAPEDMIVGASMLVADDPLRQYEFGARWNGVFVLPRNGDANLDDRLSLLRNADPPCPADYTAWWFNCFSVELPRRIGLPFPFFLKIDDVEYCLRAGARIVLANGIGVLHEAFGNKYSAALEYYAKRNELILNALYPRRGGLRASLAILLRAVAKALVFLRYATLPLLHRAFDDFLTGPDAFLRIDQERLNSELRLLGEKDLTQEELLAKGYDCTRFTEVKEIGALKTALTLNGYLLPTRKEGYRVIDLRNAKPSHFYRARRVVQYNPVTRKGFVTERKVGMLLRAGFFLLGYVVRFLFRFRRVARAYRAALKEITSEKAWRERLGMEKT